MNSFLIALTAIEDARTRPLIKIALENAGHRVIEVDTYQQTQALLDNGLNPDLLLLESVSATPAESVRFLRNFSAPLKMKIGLILGMGEEQLHNEANEIGIQHFLMKPPTRDDVTFFISKMTESPSPAVPSPFLANSLHSSASSTIVPADMPEVLHMEELGENRFFLASSPQMLEIYRHVKLVAGTDVPVLILGESGTGKEIIAHLIHKHSHRAREKFLNVNCAAIPADLLESELFGHRKGAFTGAMNDRPGKFEQANHGTILLDEIGDMSVQMQAKLLHVLQDGHVTRLGAEETTKVDVRVIAATNVEMQTALHEKTFREDLFYRLSAFTIHVPPLRERREEIPHLIEEIIRRAPSATTGCSDCGFCSRLVDLALAYEWRGNLRELRNFITRTLILRDTESAIRELESKINATNIAPKNALAINRASQCQALKSLVRNVKDRTEAEIISDTLETTGWNRRRAAQVLRISYRSLLYKIQQHKLAPEMGKTM